MRSLLLATCLCLVTTMSWAGGPSSFQRGDANQDNSLNLADAVLILGYLFPIGTPPLVTCLDAFDVNDDGGLDVSDPIFLLGHLFAGGAAPPAPFGLCGFDPTPDPLGCASFSPCSFLPPLATPIEFRGLEVVLQGIEPNGFGPGTRLHFDTDGNGVFDEIVETDADNRFVASLEIAQLLPPAVPVIQQLPVFVEDPTQTTQTPIFLLDLVQLAPIDPAGSIPVPDPLLPIPPISAQFLPIDPPVGPSLELFTQSRTANVHGVELASGRIHRRVPLRSFKTRRLGFDLALQYTTAVTHDGSFGPGFSHSFGLAIVRDSFLSGRIVTPDLRVFPISSLDAVTWTLPVGFRSQLTLDAGLRRWTLTHYSGLSVELYEGATGHPGKPLALRDPNGNRTALSYDASGALTEILTDLDQPQSFAYDANGRVSTYTDHVGQVFTLQRDLQGRVTAVVSPATPFLVAPASPSVVDPSDVTTTTRDIAAFFYDDVTRPTAITRVHDGRGIEVRRYEYDAAGRCDRIVIAGDSITLETPVVSAPAALALLDAGNVVVRVTDRVGNVTDYELHGAAGNAAGVAATGLRRTVEWTCSGVGGTATRPGEPLYYDTRWLHDSDELSATAWARPFSSLELPTLTFDVDGIPTNAPVTKFTYNALRQPTSRERTDGTDSIRTEYTYDSFSNFSRRLTYTAPRAFDTLSLYAGLSFVHTYEYDAAGNRIRHTAPTVTRGQIAPQAVVEEWEYNSFGQVTKHTDPAGNVTTYDYYAGASVGGALNTQGAYGGYTSTVTRGATGSSDASTGQATLFAVNAFGWVTARTNPRGFSTDYEYDTFGNELAIRKAAVALPNATSPRFEILRTLDQAGHCVLVRESNIDWDGTVGTAPYTYEMRYYGANSRLLATRSSVDASSGNDLVTDYAYDANENLVVVELPEGNRRMQVYDERDLLFRTYEGATAGTSILDGYPVSKTAAPTVTFLRSTQCDYDSRGNLVTHTDGRGNPTVYAYDFADRQVLRTDANGNGFAVDFDDASLPVRNQRGAVVSGAIPVPLEATYYRYDEIRRCYEVVGDLDPTTNESGLVSPVVAGSSAHLRAYDAASRVVSCTDAVGNSDSYEYDAVNRLTRSVDELGNERLHVYDANDNLVQRREREVPAPGVPGAPVDYETTYVYDELDRVIEEHDRGTVGSGIDRVTIHVYDSRDNLRVTTDEEGRTRETRYDGINRVVEEVRRDGDIATGAIVEHTHFEYDGNSNLVEQRVESTPGNPAGDQVTRTVYDSLDRAIRTVAPDSDDPTTGSGLGTDGIYDRTEIEYDGNSNVVRTTDPRGTQVDFDYDARDRQTSLDVTIPAGVSGVTRRTMEYDSIDRVTVLSNDNARVSYDYDALSRHIKETTELSLDGTGFTSGWSEPIDVLSGWDPQSNRLGRDVVDPGQAAPDLSQDYFYDGLNRVVASGARFFDDPVATRPIGDWAYHGPFRTVGMQAGNGAAFDRSYDPKRRLSSAVWVDPLANVLVGYEYAHDAVGNPLYERFLHDLALHDNFRFDALDRVTGVAFRNPAAADYRVGFPAAQEDATYDAAHNRKTGTLGNPFLPLFGVPLLLGHNAANEITSFNLSGVAHPVSHDSAGNRLQVTTLPPSSPGPNDIGVTYDAFGRAVEFDLGGGSTQEALYDPFGRRCALLVFSGSTFLPVESSRFICDGLEEVEDRRFSVTSTLANFNSVLYRVRAQAGGAVKSCLTVKDVDGDRQLLTNTNQAGPHDAIYFELCDGRGNLAAILDAGDPQRVMEYYRYQMYGAPLVLPVIDNNFDGKEDTPNSLQDNGNFAGQQSQFDVDHFLESLRYDETLGLYNNLGQYTDPISGQGLARNEPFVALLLAPPMVLGNCKNGGSVDPLNHPHLFPGIQGVKKFKGGSVDPLNHPHLFPNIPKPWKPYKGGSVDPLNNPDLFKRHMSSPPSQGLKTSDTNEKVEYREIIIPDITEDELGKMTVRERLKYCPNCLTKNIISYDSGGSIFTETKVHRCPRCNYVGRIGQLQPGVTRREDGTLVKKIDGLLVTTTTLGSGERKSYVHKSDMNTTGNITQHADGDATAEVHTSTPIGVAGGHKTVDKDGNERSSSQYIAMAGQLSGKASHKGSGSSGGLAVGVHETGGHAEALGFGGGAYIGTGGVKIFVTVFGLRLGIFF